MDLKFREYYQDTNQQRRYPRPLPAALAGGYLGYAFGGPVGGLAGAAAGYGIGKLLGPKVGHANPQDFTYYRGPDGQVYRDPKIADDEMDGLSPEEAMEKNSEPNNPFYYRPRKDGKWYPIKKSSYQQKRWQKFGQY